MANGQTLDVSPGELTLTTRGSHIATYSISDGDTISVAADATATIKGSKRVAVGCGVRADLTLDNAGLHSDNAPAQKFIDDGSAGVNHLRAMENIAHRRAWQSGNQCIRRNRSCDR